MSILGIFEGACGTVQNLPWYVQEKSQRQGKGTKQLDQGGRRMGKCGWVKGAHHM